jgi:hypothetical protein
MYISGLEGFAVGVSSGFFGSGLGAGLGVGAGAGSAKTKLLFKETVFFLGSGVGLVFSIVGENKCSYKFKKFFEVKWLFASDFKLIMIRLFLSSEIELGESTKSWMLKVVTNALLLPFVGILPICPFSVAICVSQSRIKSIWFELIVLTNSVAAGTSHLALFGLF